jgi:hypothetical protein
MATTVEELAATLRDRCLDHRRHLCPRIKRQLRQSLQRIISDSYDNPVCKDLA